MTKWELWKVSSFTWISWPVITLLMLKKTQGFWVKTQKPILFMPPGLPGGSDSKESTCSAGDLGSILGLGRCPWEGTAAAAAAAKSLQLCPTLCNPIDGSPPGSSVHGICQARTLEWVAISFSNAWQWKVKVKLLSSLRLFKTPWTAAHQAPPSMGFSRQANWSGVPLPSPGEGNHPLQYSGLGNSMDRGPWQATVHVVIKSRTRLSLPLMPRHAMWSPYLGLPVPFVPSAGDQLRPWWMPSIHSASVTAEGSEV